MINSRFRYFKLTFFILFLGFLSILSSAQEDLELSKKGIKLNSPNSLFSIGITRAVVIGISDYQDKDIPDLQFAHKDAEAFAKYLVSPVGGKMDTNHVQLIINQQATAGNVAAAIDGLLDLSIRGDVVVIYFSGHADVERKTYSQPGFLLCWDAPSRIYMGGGTYALSNLQEIITTLSIQKEVKVILITDACHAGKLAGRQIGGAEITSANLTKQYANEIKILSCQPNELSIEGAQWGEGRGVFSYFLIEGLNGFADQNGDFKISLLEIGRYLEDNVNSAVEPQSQTPIILGNKSEYLLVLDSNYLASIGKVKIRNIKDFSETSIRGFEDQILASLDSNIVKQYLAFKLALKNKEFFRPSGNCANDLYEALAKVEGLGELLGFIKRNFAAALQDDAQQVMNHWMKGDASELTLSKKLKIFKYKEFPKYLDRAAELLGDSHYMYNAIKARRHYFEGYLLALSNLNPDKELGKKAVNHFRLAIQYQEDFPQAYWQMSNVFACNFRQIDSMEFYANKAIALYPNWIMPLIDVSKHLYSRFSNKERALKYIEHADSIDSNSILVLNRWGDYYSNIGQFSLAEQKLKKAIEIDSNFIYAYHNLGNVYLDTKRYSEAILQYTKVLNKDSTQTMTLHNLACTYLVLKQYENVIHYLSKAIEYDSNFIYNYDYMGMAFMATNRYAEAEEMFVKALQLDSNSIYIQLRLGQLYLKLNNYNRAEIQIQRILLVDTNFTPALNVLGQIYLKSKNFEEAETQFIRALELDSTLAEAYYYLACLKSTQGQVSIAFKYLEKALENNILDFQVLNSSEDLANLRKNKKAWKKLLKFQAKI
ncbi:MAG: caspase family protein [Saprospiraceae bacterium]|nr:caspase family protein [Saprospiraceae bacterium]